MSTTISKILVVLLGSIGDVTRGLALARALREYSDAGGTRRFAISWLVEPKSADVVRMCPDIDEVIVFDRQASISGFVKALRVIRAGKFDIVLDLQRHAKSGLFSRFSGAARRIGFNPQNTKEFNHWFNTEFIAPWNTALRLEVGSEYSPTSKLSAYLSFLSPLDVPIPSIPAWRLDERRVDETLPAAPARSAASRLGLVLTSSWESKNWMGNEPLCRLLLKESAYEIVLIGDRSCIDLAESLRKLNPQRIVSTAGSVTLAGLVSTLRSCRAVIGPDSGPGHLSAAVGVPYIGLFGPTDPLITSPSGSESLAIFADIGCSPCYRRRCPGLNQLCLRLVTPGRVLDRLMELDRGAPKQ